MTTETLPPMDNAEFDTLESILDDLRERDEEVPQWEFCEGAMAALLCTRRPVSAEEALPVVVGVGGEEAELAFADAAGRIVERKRLKRGPFAECLQNRAPLRIVLHEVGLGQAAQCTGQPGFVTTSLRRYHQYRRQGVFFKQFEGTGEVRHFTEFLQSFGRRAQLHRLHAWQALHHASNVFSVR